MKQITVTVSTTEDNLWSGGLSGLLEMFRYCGAYPYQQSDVSLITQAVKSRGRPNADVSFRIATLTNARGGNINAVGAAAFTPERWKGFGFTLNDYRE